MSHEDRTQAPTKRRRQAAREMGLVAQSGELTAAAGLLAGVALLGAWGDDLAASLVGLMRGAAIPATLSAEGVADSLRAAALGVLGPLGAIFGGTTLAAVAAHQAQVGGLWLPGRLTPDVSRLWTLHRSGPDPLRGLWSIAKVGLVVAVTGWVLRSNADAILGLGRLEIHTFAATLGALLRSLLGVLAVALGALGAVDYALQHRRIESLLMATPDENREDQKAIEGDPALRARRRQAAAMRRFDPTEAVVGAKLVLKGAGGLVVSVGGGPIGRKPILVRAAATGSNGRRLLQAAEGAGLIAHDAPALARHFARADRAPLPAALGEELAALWPA